MAATYILKKLKDPDNRFDTTDVVVKIEAESLNDILEGMHDFIKACSFNPVGTLDFVVENDETNEET